MTSPGTPSSAAAAAYSSIEIGTYRIPRPVALDDLVDRLGEGQKPRAGQLVELADVPVIGQRGDRDVGDVVGVDERLRRVAGRERDLAAEHVLEQEVLAEVLANQVARTIVSSAPESRTACSARSASGSPRPDSSTSRRTPRSTASSANAPTVSAAPGTATSG